MNKQIKKQMKELEALKLPELQARFAEIVGEETMAPNKKYLLRRIGEALEARALNAAVDESIEAPSSELADDSTTEALTEERIDEIVDNLFDNEEPADDGPAECALAEDEQAEGGIPTMNTKSRAMIPTSPPRLRARHLRLSTSPPFSSATSRSLAGPPRATMPPTSSGKSAKPNAARFPSARSRIAASPASLATSRYSRCAWNPTSSTSSTKPGSAEGSRAGWSCFGSLLETTSQASARSRSPRC